MENAAKPGLISVAEARNIIANDVVLESAEDVPLHDAGDRILANDLKATRTQPPFNASAMDGYAMSSVDVGEQPVDLKVVGESAAGHGYHEPLSRGEAVRIFTGAPLPPNADVITIQENTEPAAEHHVRILKAEQPGKYIRPIGCDFQAGSEQLIHGTRLNAGHLSLAASIGYATIPVRKRPLIAIIATGDELVEPGQSVGQDQIISSNAYGVAHIARKAGADVLDLGIVADTEIALETTLDEARKANVDAIVTLGGASVGDHDLVKPVLAKLGIELTFYKIAMRPGKPFMFGKWEDVHIMGLPGNPVSSLVCAHLFLGHLITSLLGSQDNSVMHNGILGEAVPANDEREEYMRAIATQNADGTWEVIPFKRQDSSLLSVVSRANALMVRPAFDEARATNSLVKFMFL